MGRTRQDRTKIKEEKKKRQNSDYEASLKEPSQHKPSHMLNHQKHITPLQKKKEKSQQWGHAEDIMGYQKGHPNDNKNKKLGLNHV